MFKQLSPFARAGIFYALALALALGVTFIPGAGSALYMFTPLAAVMLMQLVITRDGYARDGWQVLGLGRLGLQAWTPAVLVPLLVMGVAYGIIWITGLARLVVPTDIDDIPVAYVPLVAVLLVLKSSLTVALGEELGWRGYLLPHIETLGRWRAALLSGLLHGIWHLPLIFLTSVYHAGVDPVVFD